jgi:hypothetical protein
MHLIRQAQLRQRIGALLHGQAIPLAALVKGRVPLIHCGGQAAALQRQRQRSPANPTANDCNAQRRRLGGGARRVVLHQAQQLKQLSRLHVKIGEHDGGRAAS